jgi:DNA mismatch endonuclease (patch repair protein)
VPKTNRRFWNAKFRRNMARDATQEERLSALGWRLIVVWECELIPRVRAETLTRLCEDIRTGGREEPLRLVAESSSPYRV